MSRFLLGLVLLLLAEHDSGVSSLTLTCKPNSISESKGSTVPQKIETQFVKGEIYQLEVKAGGELQRPAIPEYNMTIHGSLGNISISSGKISSQSVSKCTGKLYFKGAMIGNPRYITVERLPSISQLTWYPKSLMLTSSLGNWYEEYTCWEVSGINTIKRRRSITRDISVTVRTSAAWFGGTDARIYLKIHGKKKVSEEKRLFGNFERGNADTTDISIGDIGIIAGITIRHDGTGENPNWQLSSVTISETGEGSYYFDCSCELFGGSGRFISISSGLCSEIQYCQIQRCVTCDQCLTSNGTVSYHKDGNVCVPQLCTSGGSECGSHGSCNTGAVPYVCVCRDGYSGNLCQTPPPCTPGGNECGSHSICNTGAVPYVCTCADGYSGKLCQTPPICTSNGTECGSHGSCNTGAVPYVCVCTDGYSGSLCQTQPPQAPCTFNGGECGDHGTCNTGGPIVKCSCADGFTGTLCGTDINECTSGTNNCHDTLATCDNILGSYTCTCIEGYEGNGVNCRDINECTSGTNNCHDTLATCDNILGSYTCTCIEGYEGNGVNCRELAGKTPSTSPVLIGVIARLLGVVFVIVIIAGFIVWMRRSRHNTNTNTNTAPSTTAQINRGYELETGHVYDTIPAERDDHGYIGLTSNATVGKNPYATNAVISNV